MLSELTRTPTGPNFEPQIRYLKDLESPLEFAFLLQVFLVTTASVAAYVLAGWWECVVWCVAYIGLQVLEKTIVRIIPSRPSQLAYSGVVAILLAQAAVYCVMPVYLWFLGPDIAKFGALALITASSIHTMLHRARFPSVLLCFLIPNATVFITISTSLSFSGESEDYSILYLICGFVITAFFLSIYYQAFRRETNAGRALDGRKLAEAERDESEIRFKSLFENTPIPIREEDLSGMKRLIDELDIPDPVEFACYLDENPEFLLTCSKAIVVVDANRASLKQHGYSHKSEMLAKVVDKLSPASMKIVRMTVETLHSGGQGKSYETKITRSDGKTRIVSAQWTVIPGHEDTYSRILLCSLDLTERLKSEQALRQAQKMEAVGQLTGGVAHDFNNLLTVIGGNVDLMEIQQGFDRDLLDHVRKAVGRGAELTQRLLAFSRIQPLDPVVVNVRGLVLEMRELISRTLGEEYSVLIDFKGEPWSAVVDPGQLESALLNLALNSRDAMTGGGVLTIFCKHKKIDEAERNHDPVDLAPGDYVVIGIKDTGTGMSEDVVSRAFEPFFTTKEIGKGSGLGLSSIYGFAKQSGGDVHIQSSLGTGTTISLYLPGEAQSKPEPSQVRAKAKTIDGTGLTVLILEDEPAVLQYLTRLLSSFGFQVHQAANAGAAYEIVREGGEFDLLLSDVMLPGGVRGPEFGSMLKDISPDTAFVFLSGRPAEAHMEQFPNLSHASVLQKPFEMGDLVDAINEALFVKSQ